MVPPWDHILGEMGTLSLLAQLSLGWGALLRLPSWVAPISCGTICLPAMPIPEDLGAGTPGLL